MAEVAAKRLDPHFIIIGPIVKIDPASLPPANSIHYLGSRKYSESPDYLAGWDAAFMPFALNDATRFISPTKTPEYLAAGKMIVSMPIHDVVRDYGEAGLVAIAVTAQDFSVALDNAILPATVAWPSAVDEKLSRLSWDRTWPEMEVQINLVARAAKMRTNLSDSDREIVTRQSPENQSSEVILTAEPSVITGIRPSSLVNRSNNVRARSEKFDYVVVGAGFADAVMAERLARTVGKRVLIIDKREHIAGNAYDFHNADGILIHRYGPHIFHTNSTDVANYLSQFTSWRPYKHRVLASVDSQLLPVPINLDTLNKLYDLNLDAAGMKELLAARVTTPSTIQTSEDIVVSRVGRELYEKFFMN